MLDNQNRLEERMHDLEGQLAAIRANGEGVAPPTSPASLRSSLTEVIEPEVGLNVMDLGLIRDVRVGSEGVEIHMAMTYPECPQADYLVSQVRRKAQNASNGAPVRIVVVDAEAAESEADGGLPLNSQEVAESR
jgi:serine O-acetyltransferase